MYYNLQRVNVRALCTDIDGTLLNDQRELSAKTIAAIRKISSSMPIILASSRMPRAMRHLQAELGILKHPLICYNGGYVTHSRDNDTLQVLYSVHIPFEICTAILGLVSETSVHMSLYLEDQWFAPRMDQWAVREATITKVSPTVKPGDEVLDLWQKSQQGAHKIMIMGEAVEIKALEVMLRSMFSNDIHVYHSKSTYLEIAPKVISKGSALQLLLEKVYNIPLSDVIAFGDNYNDIDLLQSVGWGIAVENARKEVKAVAKEVTLGSKQDGVAHSIYKHLIMP